MTNGTSQGLFVVIAIIIFGIFVGISYLLFRDTLKPSLSNIFTDGLNQANCLLTNNDESNVICNPTFHNSFEISGTFSLGFKDTKNSFGTTAYPLIWTPSNQSVRTINLKSYIDSGSSLNIENGLVEISTINDNSVKVKQSYIDNGFGTNNTRKVYVSINGQDDIYLGSSNYPNTDWGNNKGLKLKINEQNTIRWTYENVHGGKTVYTFHVNIINQ